MIRVFVNGRELDYDSGAIEVTRQVNDIFFIQSRFVDYTRSILVPKTANNVEILEGLGFADTNLPYKKIKGDVEYDGVPLLQNGSAHLLLDF